MYPNCLWGNLIAVAILSLGVISVTPVHAQSSPQDIASLRNAAIESPDRQARLSALWTLSDIYRDQGKLREAYDLLVDADIASESKTEQTLTALRQTGIALGLGLTTEAADRLAVTQTMNNSLNSLDRPLEKSSQIALLFEEASFYVELEQYQQAIEYFKKAAELAEKHNLTALEARARINIIHAKLDNYDLVNLELGLDEIDALVRSLPEDEEMIEEKAFLALATGDLYRKAVTDYLSDNDLLEHAESNYNLASKISTSPALLAYAYGFLGTLHEEQGLALKEVIGRLHDDDEIRNETLAALAGALSFTNQAIFSGALSFTNQAIFYAQEADDLEQHYRWEWQSARILKALNRIDDSRSAYDRAVTILNQVRPNFVLGSGDTFDSLVRPVYVEYADILLEQAPNLSGSVEQEVLKKARDQLEELNRGEVEDYFESECAANPNIGEIRSSFTVNNVAVIYPLVLENRIEVLVEVAGYIHQYSQKVDRDQFISTVRNFRIALEDKYSLAYKEPAQQLYDWMIADSYELLRTTHNIETLMIVPGGALRTVPFAALYDSKDKEFLIQQFAVATTPSIDLIEIPDAQSKPKNILIGGLIKSVQGFVPLPGVGIEIKSVFDTIGNDGVLLQDDNFRTDVIEKNLASSEFSIAHFATHGEYRGDFEESFILTHDSRLTFNRLKNILEQRQTDTGSLDLLVLSACETAAGDDRAALGLAGIAVQSGAKSVVSSLWEISDAATAALMPIFYKNLFDSTDSNKAASLQAAQLALLNELEEPLPGIKLEWAHPSYWAPFMLIGNWQ